MDAIKAILLVTTILLLSGCGVYDRSTIQFRCNKNGNVIVYVYKAKMVSIDENITQPRFLTYEKMLDNDDFEVTCKKINK